MTPTPGDFAPTRRIVVVGLGNNPITADFSIPVPHVWTKTEEVAHRGDVLTSPENTFAAFTRAIGKGATHIEFDVYLNDTAQVVVAHGAKYKAAPDQYCLQAIDCFDAPTQVYGPTQACQGQNVETTGWATIGTCDIGTTMKHPKFKDERFPLLTDVLARYPAYNGWMIELKATERVGLSAEQKAQQNRALGAAVQQVLEQTGRTDL